MRHPLTILLLLLLPMAVFAARPEIFIEDQPNVSTPENLEEPAPWKEGKTELPPLPKDDDLIEFEVRDPSKHFRYYLDTTSLSVGEDRVVRYILVITSKQGARNVSYEGMRCDTNEFKIYAFGSAKGKLRPLRKPEWKEMRKNNRTNYRDDLKRFYLCHPEYPRARKPEVIIQSMKYGVGQDCVLCD